MFYDVLQNINTHAHAYKYIVYIFFRRIGTLCGLSKRYQVSRIIACAKSVLISNFVPNCVRFGAISRK